MKYLSSLSGTNSCTLVLSTLPFFVLAYYLHFGIFIQFPFDPGDEPTAEVVASFVANLLRKMTRFNTKAQNAFQFVFVFREENPSERVFEK